MSAVSNIIPLLTVEWSNHILDLYTQSFFFIIYLQLHQFKYAKKSTITRILHIIRTVHIDVFNKRAVAQQPQE